MKKLHTVASFVADLLVALSQIIVSAVALVFILANIHHHDHVTDTLNMFQAMAIVTGIKILFDSSIGIIKFTFKENPNEE